LPDDRLDRFSGGDAAGEIEIGGFDRRPSLPAGTKKLPGALEPR
jgi:hypothetical protein